MSERRRTNIREDGIDKILDRLCDMREELLAIERSLERVQAAKLEQGKDGSGKDSRVVR
jgi:hypothetical protein